MKIVEDFLGRQLAVNQTPMVKIRVPISKIKEIRKLLSVVLVMLMLSACGSQVDFSHHEKDPSKWVGIDGKPVTLSKQPVGVK